MKLLLGLTLFSSICMAAIPQKPLQMSHIIQGMGSIRGGQSSGIYSLLDLRRTYSAKAKIERLVVDLGEANFEKSTGPVGYYQVEVKQNPPRLILNFSQALNSKFESRELANRLKGAAFVKGSRMDFDRIGQALYITLDLKKPVSVRAIPVKGGQETAKLVIDLIDNLPATKKR